MINKNYDGFNDAPEGLREITLDEWTRGIFHYCIQEPKMRQVREPDNNIYFDLRLFPVPNFENKQLGYGLIKDWFDPETSKNRKEHLIKFCIYGTEEDWNKFERMFAAQFAGDNS